MPGTPALRRKWESQPELHSKITHREGEKEGEGRRRREAGRGVGGEGFISSHTHCNVDEALGAYATEIK